MSELVSMVAIVGVVAVVAIVCGRPFRSRISAEDMYLESKPGGGEGQSS
jgi:hypothetical protein